jgi:hypothetical protein
MATLLRWILEFVFRPTGRHRATGQTPVPQERPPLPLRALPLHARCEVFDGSAVALVRPYLIAHEQRREAHRQRERRRALVLATMGIDYPAEVAA